MTQEEELEAELLITQDCIWSLMFYAIAKEWPYDRFTETCKEIGISQELLDMTFNDS